MSPPAKTLLRAAWLAPMDGPPLRDAAVVFASGTIIDVGPSATLSQAHPDATVVDAGNSIILPGLINPHVHLELSDLPLLPAPGPLAHWLIEVIKRSPRGDDPPRVRHAVEAGVSQCLRFGVTTVGDITRQPALTRTVLKASKTTKHGEHGGHGEIENRPRFLSGLRGLRVETNVLSEARGASPLRVVSFGEVQAMATRRDLLEPRLAAAIDRTHEGDRLQVGLSPHAPYSVEPPGYARCLDLSRAQSLPLATHLAESPDEAPFLSHHTGPFRDLWQFLNAWDDHVPTFQGGPIRLAKHLGLLDHPILLAHVNYCDDAELALLAAGRASVVYCPRTHAHFAHPSHRWRDMLAAGVNVALGTDSLASAPDLNVLDDLRLLHQLAPDVPAIDLWPLITTRAARALGMDAMIGSLTPGQAADFTIFPVAGPDPLSDILDQQVLPSEVWIAGKRA